jgi:hypothetical protein
MTLGFRIDMAASEVDMPVVVVEREAFIACSKKAVI